MRPRVSPLHSPLEDTKPSLLQDYRPADVRGISQSGAGDALGQKQAGGRE